MDLRNPWALKEPMWNLHRDLGPGLVGPRSRRAALLDGFFTRSVTGGGLSLIGGVGGGRSCRPAGEPSSISLTRSSRKLPSTLVALMGFPVGAAEARRWMGTLVGGVIFLWRLGGGAL